MALGDSFEVDSGSYTPESLKLRRRLAETMMQQGMNSGPISSPWQGVNRIVQAMMGGYQMGELERKEGLQQDAASKALMGLLGPGTASAGATPSAMPAPVASAPRPRSVQNADGTSSTFIGEVGPSTPNTGPMAQWKSAIAGIETPGSKNPYGELGPVVKSGDRAYGKYQVMGENVPVWTKEILGQQMTPQQFLASPEAQELVFAAKFGSYVQKYGSPEAAASVWFTGRPSAPNARASNPDGSPLGISGAEYVQKFSGGLDGQSGVSAPAAVQIAAQTQGGGGLAPQVDEGTRRQIGQLLANPQTRPIGQALLLRLVQQQGTAPDIKEIEVRDQYGRTQKVPAVFNPQSRRFEPVSLGGPSRTPTAQAMPAGQPVMNDASPAMPAPPMPITSTEFIGEVGAMPSAQGAAQPPIVQPGSAAGNENFVPGPAADEKRVGPGYMQRSDAQGRPLWQNVGGVLEPVTQPKAQYEAEARLGEKRQSDQAIASEASTRARSVVESAKSLTELPGFEKALEINRKRLEYSVPGWIGKADPTTVKQQLERIASPDDPAWRADSAIQSLQNQLVLGLMQLAPQKGPQSDKDAKRYEDAVGDLANSTSSADFKLRLNRVMNLQTQLTPGTSSKDYVPEAPSMNELQDVYNTDGSLDQKQVDRISKKYGIGQFDVQQLASHATNAPTKSQIWIGQ
jgi:hypothetical protein